MSEEEEEEDSSSTIYSNEFLDESDLAKQYLTKLYTQSPDLDETYGVRLKDVETNKLQIGNMELKIVGSNDDISIGDKTFRGGGA